MSRTIDYDVLKYFENRGHKIEEVKAKGGTYYITRKYGKRRTVDIFKHEDQDKKVSKEAYQRLMKGGVFVYRNARVGKIRSPSSEIFFKSDVARDYPPYFAGFLPWESTKLLRVTETAYKKFKDAKYFSKVTGENLSDSKLMIQMSMTWMGLCIYEEKK